MSFSTLRYDGLYKNKLSPDDISDMILIIPDQEEMVRIPVHRAIMSSFSPLIKNLMISQDVSDMVIIVGSTREEIESLVNHIYKGEDAVISKQLALELGVHGVALQGENEKEDENNSKPLQSNRNVVLNTADCVERNLNVETKQVQYNKLNSDYLDNCIKQEFSSIQRVEKEIEGYGGKFKEDETLKKENLGDINTDDVDDLMMNENEDQQVSKDTDVKTKESIEYIYDKKSTSNRIRSECSPIETLLFEYPNKFRLFNKYVYLYPYQRHKITRQERSQEMINWEQFPGLIYEEELTQFVVCIECAKVFLNRPRDHICTTSVDILKNKTIEIVPNMTYRVKPFILKHFNQVNVDKIKCVHCEEEFENLKLFKNHLQTMHGIEIYLWKAAKLGLVGDYICDDCGKRFNQRKTLNDHELNKHDRKELGNFFCPICAKAFIRKSVMEKHKVEKHSDIRPFICEICDKTFKAKKHLENHKTVHTGARDWPCRHCERTFAKDWTRTQHERLHLGVKLYNCNQCGIKFSQQHSLGLHMKNHHRQAEQS